MWRCILSCLALTASVMVGLAVLPATAAAQGTVSTGASTSRGTFSASGGYSTSTNTSSSTTGSPAQSASGGQTSTTSGTTTGPPPPPPTGCTPVWTGNASVTSSCASQLPSAGGQCAIGSTQVTLFGVPLGVVETMGTWSVVWTGSVGRNAGHRAGTATCGGTATTLWIGYSPPVPPTVTLAWRIIDHRLLASATPQRPTPWIMPSPAHPGPPPCSACTTYQESIEGYANHPEWLAIQQGPGVTSGLSATTQQCSAGVCATVGVTLTPETVNFEWVGADSYPPFGAPAHTVSCPAGATVTGAPAPLGYAPAADSLARAYDTWQHALWWQWFDKHAIYGGPGCNGSRWEGGNGTPRQEVDYLQGVGGGHPRVEFYTPRQVTRQDCLDVGNTAANPWPAWCYQVPRVDTIRAYLTYHVTWTFGGVLAGQAPPGLPHTYDVMTQDPAAVATTTLPVVAEHTHPTCFSGTGSKQQCNVNTPPGTGDMGPAPING